MYDSRDMGMGMFCIESPDLDESSIYVTYDEGSDGVVISMPTYPNRTTLPHGTVRLGDCVMEQFVITTTIDDWDDHQIAITKMID